MDMPHEYFPSYLNKHWTKRGGGIWGKEHLERALNPKVILKTWFLQ